MVEVREILLRAGEAQRVVQHLAGQGAGQGVLTVQDLHIHHVGGLHTQYRQAAGAGDYLFYLLVA